MGISDLRRGDPAPRFETPEMALRQRCEAGTTQEPAEASNRASAPHTILLNDLWRVTYDPLQWILAVRQGVGPSGKPRWRDRAFTTTLPVLKRDIRRLCGDTDPAAMRIIDALPERHPRIERLPREIREAQS